MPHAAPPVALETTLLVHGISRDKSLGLSRELAEIVRAGGAIPELVGVLRGKAVVGMSESQLSEMLALPSVPKLNTANLGIALARGWSGATTVSATMELAAAAGIRVFATGGLGGVHKAETGSGLDVSSDLVALTRFPVAVVTSGVKSILDVHATREVLETLGVPVVGFRTDQFPAFYLRRTEPPIGVDARFDDVKELAAFVRAELMRSGRGIVVVNPIPAGDEISQGEWEGWLIAATALAVAAGVSGRGVTPFVLGKLHELSGGATLRANVALIKANAGLAGRLARAMSEGGR